MRKALHSPTHFQTRRRLLAGMAAMAGLSACGGSVSRPPTVTDRLLAVSTGVTLHVRDWAARQDSDKGQGQEQVIVLLAGLGATAHTFDSLAPALARRGRVLAITRRGYGQSGKPSPSGDSTYAPATLAADLLAVLDALKVQRIVLAGHSIAGNEVTLFAGMHPDRVRGVVYLDTTFDYWLADQKPWNKEPMPTAPYPEEPEQQAMDTASLAAAIAYAKRINKNWWPALDATLRDTLDVLPDGSVQPNTPAGVALAMYQQSHVFSPDYRRVRAPALVVTADPTTLRDIFPWLSPQSDPATLAAARAWQRIYRLARADDIQNLLGALPGCTHLAIDNAFHSDFFIEYETAVVAAIEAMRWR